MIDQIMEIIRDNYEVPDIPVTADTELTADLELSSFQLVELSVMIEDAMDVEIDEDELAAVVTLGDIAALVEKHREEKEND